jgi:hypothetical protein
MADEAIQKAAVLVAREALARAAESNDAHHTAGLYRSGAYDTHPDLLQHAATAELMFRAAVILLMPDLTKADLAVCATALLAYADGCPGWDEVA